VGKGKEDLDHLLRIHEPKSEEGGNTLQTSSLGGRESERGRGKNRLRYGERGNNFSLESPRRKKEKELR